MHYLSLKRRTFQDMVTEVTRHIKVSVETFYQKEYSDPFKEEYMFAYRITIENEGESTVKLLRRHWFIWDANNTTREVEGEGVVGVQPIIVPGGRYQYVSGCHLKTEIGKMHGKYLMRQLKDGKQFYVNIPVFEMITPQKLN